MLVEITATSLRAPPTTSCGQTRRAAPRKAPVSGLSSQPPSRKNRSESADLGSGRVRSLPGRPDLNVAAKRNFYLSATSAKIRQEVRRILEDLLANEEKLDKAARMKIESQRRIIPEGTPEWNILYHKYYNEEVKKLGI